MINVMYIHKTKTKRNKAIYINITSFFMLTLQVIQKCQSN